MRISSDACVRIANAGGSLIVDNSISSDAMQRIAHAIHVQGVGHLTIKATSISSDAMARIANAAPGRVTFDVTEQG
ncbi:hypothetical protein AB7M31_002423 [Pseudomonas sp. IAP-CY TE4608]